MRILVTGGAGFIGTHLCRRLIKDGHDLAIVDNLFERKWEKRENLRTLFEIADFRFYQKDIRDYGGLLSVIHRFSPECVIHLAALAGVRRSFSAPEQYTDVNVTGTAHILELARAGPDIKRFVFASSSSVYGTSVRLPMSESTHVVGALSTYAATKKAGEDLCYVYSQFFTTVCLRFFTVYGPGQRYGMAIDRFFRRAINGREIEIYGDPRSTRDYTYIDDIVEGITASITAEMPSRFNAINLGSGREVSLAELVEMIGDICGRKLDVRCIEAQPGDAGRTLADLAKARKILGYEPKTEITEGLKCTYERIKFITRIIDRMTRPHGV